MSQRKHGTLTIDTEATVTVTGRGYILVSNHGVPGTATPEPIYALVDATVALAADDSIPIIGGRPRVIANTDQDGSVDVHLICHTANKYSVEIVTADTNEL